MGILLFQHGFNGTSTAAVLSYQGSQNLKGIINEPHSFLRHSRVWIGHLGTWMRKPEKQMEIGNLLHVLVWHAYDRDWGLCGPTMEACFPRGEEP